MVRRQTSSGTANVSNYQMVRSKKKNVRADFRPSIQKTISLRNVTSPKIKRSLKWSPKSWIRNRLLVNIVCTLNFGDYREIETRKCLVTLALILIFINTIRLSRKWLCSSTTHRPNPPTLTGLSILLPRWRMSQPAERIKQHYEQYSTKIGLWFGYGSWHWLNN